MCCSCEAGKALENASSSLNFSPVDTDQSRTRAAPSLMSSWFLLMRLVGIKMVHSRLAPSHREQELFDKFFPPVSRRTAPNAGQMAFFANTAIE